VLARDWIGLVVEVVDSPNPSEIGLKGMVVDETMKTLRIETEKGMRMVAKSKRVFEVEIEGERFRVNGDLIAFRPEERIMRGLMMANRIKGLMTGLIMVTDPIEINNTLRGSNCAIMVRAIAG